jgi:outer membrane lipoprotein-sorting protein
MRRRLIVFACLVLVLLIAGITIYLKSRPILDRPNENAFTSNPDNSRVPPFPTREPETYQATRIVTFSQSGPNNIESPTQVRSGKVFLARDGVQRREEFEVGESGSIVFLENVNGRFIILPQPKLYADANESNASEQSELQVDAELMSPDFLLHESNTATQYQKLGPETVAGRLATKYRVMTSASGSAASHEGLIWIDETLGMPIATQYTSTSENDSIRVSMELQNIRTAVDPQTFALPADHRKVALSQIIALIRARKATPAVQDDRK